MSGMPRSCRRDALPGISLATAEDLTRAIHGGLSQNAWMMPEIWLTGTPFCMLPAVSLDGRPIGDGNPGPVFKKTLAKWSAMVGVDIQEQITRWDSQG